MPMPSLFRKLRVLIVAWVAAACFQSIVDLDALGAGSQPPNIVFILTDDQRADTIAALGNASMRTPNLDRLARNGFAFMNARNQGGLQGAVCVPSRAMLWSGQSLWHANEQLEGRVTLGQWLGGNGYRTFGTGKWHNGDASLLRTFAEARNITEGFLPNGHTSAFRLRHVSHGQLTASSNTPPVYSTALIGQTAVDFINRAAKEPGSPFFLYAGFNAPHDPFGAPPEYRNLYLDKQGSPVITLPGNVLRKHPFNAGVHDIRDEVLLPTPRPVEALLRQNVEYAAMISQVDAWVGRILAALEANGLANNTLVVFTSDQGLARGSHGLLGKQNLYEHSLKVPLILSGPKVPKGRSAAPVYLFDLFSTLTDYAGIQTPEGQMDGPSLRPFMEGKAPPPHKVMYHGYTKLMRAVCDGPWKLIVYSLPGGSTRIQLFNLEKDPLETKDFCNEPSQADRVERLKQLLREQAAGFNDPLRLWRD